MNRLSGSQLPRYMQCVGAAVIPSVRRVGGDGGEEANESADRGVVIHQFLDDVSKLGYAEALASVPPEYMADCLCMDVDALPASRPKSYSSEVQFAWNPITLVARVGLPGPGEVGGKLDSVGMDETTVYVDDYKTGRKHLGRAENSHQLRPYSLFAARAFGRTRAVVSFIRLNRHGEPKHITATFEAEDLTNIENELVDLVGRIFEADQLPLEKVSVTEGPECAWCPSFLRCPAKRNLLASAADLVSDEDITPEALGRAWERIAAVRRAADKAEKLVSEAVTAFGSVPLPSGKVLVKAPTKKGRLVLDKAKELLLTTYGAEGLEAVLEVEESMTLGRLEDMVANRWRSTYGKKGTTDAVKAARVAFEHAGALTYDRGYTLKEMSPDAAMKLLEEKQKAAAAKLQAGESTTTKDNQNGTSDGQTE